MFGKKEKAEYAKEKKESNRVDHSISNRRLMPWKMKSKSTVSDLAIERRETKNKEV